MTVATGSIHYYGWNCYGVVDHDSSRLNILWYSHVVHSGHENFQEYCIDSDLKGKVANMNSISIIASSALRAFSTSQQITANNVANLNTDGLQASRATFQENGSGGVTSSASSTGDTVDISREAVNLISNVQGFKANLDVLKATDEMSKQLLNIKAWVHTYG